jgi:hypothetical protein
MNKTLVLIVAVVAVFAVVYLAAPDVLDGLRETGQGTRLSGMPKEGNGLIGRLIDFLAESRWNPMPFYLGLTTFVAVFGGLILYWVSIRD